jgi:hypothetical protein
MKRILRTAVAVRLSALLLALAAPGVASAAIEASIDCSLQSIVAVTEWVPALCNQQDILLP